MTQNLKIPARVVGESRIEITNKEGKQEIRDYINLVPQNNPRQSFMVEIVDATRRNEFASGDIVTLTLSKG